MDPVLLIFIGLAAFVIFRLISVLGERGGHEQQHDIEGLQRAARGEARMNETGEDARADDRLDDRDRGPREDAAEAPQPVSPAAQPIRAADPTFDEAEFLTGAKSAYEMIVEAFTAGDLKPVRDFLAPNVYETFKAAIAAREAANQTAEVKFIGIDGAAIASARVEDRTAFAVTDFSSNQVRVTRDASGTVVDGDPNRIDLVRDRWTFSRVLDSRSPNWMLTATGAA
ncbi:MAG: Tim44/TimA family putative adaptor protein [Pseudomonadota bacterium]